MQYRALRCAHDAGMDVFVLGGKDASRLRYSVFCRGFRQCASAVSEASSHVLETLRLQIEACVAEWGIDIVLPGDKDGVRVLSQLQRQLAVPCFPVPASETFKLLDDKWTFHGVCQELGLPVPRTWLFETRDAVLASARRGELPERAIAKPTQLFGELGICRFRASHAAEDLAAVTYSPVLVQEFLDGVDVNCTIVALEGKSHARLHYADLPSERQFGCDPVLLSYVEQIAAHLRLSGIFNFDTRHTASNGYHLLECNPRPFMSMQATMQAGINCYSVGMKSLAGEAGPALTMVPVTVPKWRGIVRGLIKPWTMHRKDWKVLGDALADPLPLVYEATELVSRKLSVSVSGSKFMKLMMTAEDAVLSRLSGTVRWLSQGTVATRKM